MKNLLQRINTWKGKVLLGLLWLHVTIDNAYAQQQPVDLTNLQGTSGAGTKQATDILNKGTTVANSAANTLLVCFGLGGLALIGASLFAMHKASKDDRDSPKAAIVGLVIGGLATSVAVIAGVIRNTLLN